MSEPAVSRIRRPWTQLPSLECGESQSGIATRSRSKGSGSRSISVSRHDCAEAPTLEMFPCNLQRGAETTAMSFIDKRSEGSPSPGWLEMSHEQKWTKYESARQFLNFEGVIRGLR